MAHDSLTCNIVFGLTLSLIFLKKYDVSVAGSAPSSGREARNLVDHLELFCVSGPVTGT
jgi:hypothetical protein